MDGHTDHEPSLIYTQRPENVKQITHLIIAKKIYKHRCTHTNVAAGCARAASETRDKSGESAEAVGGRSLRSKSFRSLV